MADSSCSLSSGVVMWRVSRVLTSTAATSDPHSCVSESDFFFNFQFLKIMCTSWSNLIL